MKEYLDKIYSILNDARMSIIDEGYKLQENTQDELEAKKIKLISSHFDILLDGIITFKDEIENKIYEKTNFMNNTGVKIVLNEEPLDDAPTNGVYAYESDGGIFVTDEDPVVVETKSGKKIVLDEEPLFYINNTGKKIVLEDEPDFKLNGKIVLDEDPISITTKEGKKIILDEDPVNNVVKTNKVIVLSEDPLFKIGNIGGSFTLDEDPKFNLNDKDENKEIVDQIIKIRDILRGFNEPSNKEKVIYLDEDPEFKIKNDGNSFTLDEDPNFKINNKIVLDEDPVNISINVEE